MRAIVKDLVSYENLCDFTSEDPEVNPLAQNCNPITGSKHASRMTQGKKDKYALLPTNARRSWGFTKFIQRAVMFLGLTLGLQFAKLMFGRR